MNIETHTPLPLPALLAVLAFIAWAASGCTSTKVKDVIPQDGPTMEQIYDAHMGRIRATEAAGARLELKGRPAADPRPVPQAPEGNERDSAPRLMTVSGPRPSTEIDEYAGEPGVMKVSLASGAAHGGVALDNLGAATDQPPVPELVNAAASPQEGPTATTSDGAPLARPVLGLRATDVNLAGYTRTAAREIDAVFARLPNPDLVMYVFPHLAGPDAAPVPGYATSFPMYERIEYALPGEIPGEGP